MLESLSWSSVTAVCTTARECVRVLAVLQTKAGTQEEGGITNAGDYDMYLK